MTSLLPFYKGDETGEEGERIRAIRSRTDNGSVLQKRFPSFFSTAFNWHRSVFAVASGGRGRHGAVAFSREVCQGGCHQGCGTGA